MNDNKTENKVPLWRWQELSAGLTAEALSGPDITGVGVDSRLISPGELFVALPGDPGPRFNPSYRSDVDGHDYVAAAAAAGAAGALVHKSRAELQLPADFPLLQVPDTYDGLWALGRLARARFGGDVVAVTGSSGKTTAKHFLAAALQAYAPPGSFNNHIGVPLSLANTPPHSPVGVFEIGTNHPGEIEPLAAMTAADVAIVLNVHSAHIENFPDWAALKDEKLSIFNSLNDKSKAISEKLLGLDYGLSFGESAAADAQVTEVTGDRATIVFQGRAWQVRVPGGGIHRAKTVAAVLLACHQLGRDPEAACDIPGDIIPRGRGNIHTVGNVVLVDDSYNANPDSMLASINSFAALQSPVPKIAVIGEMLELGDAAQQAHLDLQQALQSCTRVMFVGDGTRELAQVMGMSWYEEAGDELSEELVQALAEGGSLLVKGSNRVFWQRDYVPELLNRLAGADVS